MRIKELTRDAEDMQWINCEPERQLMEKMYKAYREARKGKRKTVDVQRFEANLDANLKILCEQIRNFLYQPSPGTAHIIHRPVIRETFAAPFQDRVVHHLIYDEVYPYLDKRFIYDSYSCREEKGTLFGIERLAYHIRAVSRNGARKVYIVKMDMLDRFVVYDLGYKHYGRYVDDFYIVVVEEELPQLMKDVEAIRLFLLTKRLTLHPKKMAVVTPEMGVPFLGAVVHGDYILPGERLKRNFRRACVEMQAGERDIETFVSYLGHVEHFDKIRFLSQTLEEVIGLDYKI